MFRYNPPHAGLSPNTGPGDASLSWTYETGDAISSSPAIGADGTLYVGSIDNNIYAVAADGALLWSYMTQATVGSSPAIGSDGRIFVGSGSSDRRVYAFNPDGSLSWTYQADGSVNSSPVLDGDGGLYVGANDGRLYALTSEGSLSWSYQLIASGWVSSSPALDTAGNVYVGLWSDMLYAIDSSGSFLWSYYTGAGVLSSPAVGQGGSIYFGTRGNSIFSFTSGGTLAWTYDVGGNIDDASPGISPDGRIIQGGQDDRVYALNQDGSLSWTYVTGDEVNSSPAIGADGMIYIGCDDDRLYALDSAGAFSWSFVTGDSIQSSPSIGSDGKLYVGSFDSMLYALGALPDNLALLVSQNAGDLNIYFWNSLDTGDWTYWDAYSRNPSPIARDMWQIPTGNDAVGMTSIDLEGSQGEKDDLALLVSEDAGDLNLYFWNAPVIGDWTYWDADSRNPSPLARDLWKIPTGNDAVDIASVDVVPGGQDELAMLVSENAGDLNLYVWNAPVAGDWTYWDADTRNPSPLARDLWQIPIGNTAVGMTPIDITGDGYDELALLVQQGAGDLNIYFWNSLVPGDWTYWDCFSRNPSPLARDLWQIPVGNDAVGVTSVDHDGDGRDELAVLVSENAGDLNIYFWNAPVAGDWTYWDCYSRNPSPLARDLWQIPIGNDAVGISDIGLE